MQKCGDFEALLVAHDIKPTANRIVVAKTLAAAERPMSLSELEYKILSIDKSGVFRALTLFREHHLVHVIEDGGDGVRYELCLSHDGHEHAKPATARSASTTSPYPASNCPRATSCRASTIWPRASVLSVQKKPHLAIPAKRGVIVLDDMDKN